MIATRLDRVVRLREEEEERTELTLAEAIRRVAAAREAVRVAEEAIVREDQRETSAGLHSIGDLARVRLRIGLRRAEGDLAQALQDEEKARAGHREAHTRTESVRRVAGARREEQRVEGLRDERREHDAVGALMFVRRPSRTGA